MSILNKKGSIKAPSWITSANPDKNHISRQLFAVFFITVLVLVVYYSR